MNKKEVIQLIADYEALRERLAEMGRAIWKQRHPTQTHGTPGSIEDFEFYPEKDLFYVYLDTSCCWSSDSTSVQIPAHYLDSDNYLELDKIAEAEEIRIEKEKRLQKEKEEKARRKKEQDEYDAKEFERLKKKFQVQS